MLVVILTTSQQVNRTLEWIAAIRAAGAIGPGATCVVTCSEEGVVSTAVTGQERMSHAGEAPGDVTLAVMAPAGVEVSSRLFGRLGSQALAQVASLAHGDGLDLVGSSLDPGYAAILVDVGDFSGPGFG